MTTPKTSRDVESVIWRQAVPEGVDPVWHIITWDIPAGTVPVERVRELLDTCDLQSVPTPPIRESGALLRALKEMAEDRLTRQVFNDVDETAWALIRIASGDKDTKRAHMTQELTVTYRKRPRAGEPSVEYSDALAREQIEPLLLRYKACYTARDITSHVLSFAIRKAGGISMRSQGGMYVVPPTGGETVERLRRFVALLAQEPGIGEMASSHMTDLQTVDSGRTKEDMRWHGHRALVSDLRAMQTKLRDMLKRERTDADGKSKVKPETAAGYLADCDELGQRAALWRDAASLSVREVSSALDELRAAFTSVRAGMLLGDFDTTLKRVDRAIRSATSAPTDADAFDDTTSAQATSAATSAAADDPFALDDDEA